MPLEKLARFLFPRELKLIKTESLKPYGIRFYLKKTPYPEFCPKCAQKSEKVHDYRTVKIKDEPIRGKAVELVIKKRRLWCNSCDKAFTEPIEKISKGHRTTASYKRGMCWAAETFSDLKRVRKYFRCSYNLLYNCVYENYRSNLKERDYPLPDSMGVDEHSIRKLKYSPVDYATVLVDHSNRRVYDVIEGNTLSRLREEIQGLSGADQVKLVTIDFSNTYRSFIKESFPNAKIVIDRFHMHRLFTKRVNKLRMRVTGDDRKNPIRRLLLRNSRNLKPFERKAVLRWLNFHPDLREMYNFKESVNRFYRIKGFKRAKKALTKILDKMGKSKVELVRSLRKVLVEWKDEIVNFFRFNGISNGRTEGFNRKAKLIQRRAYGYRNFANYRLALLHACK